MTTEDAITWLSEAKQATFLAVDTETSGDEIRDSRGYAVGVSIAFRASSSRILFAYFPFRHRRGFNYDISVLNELKDLIENSTCLVFHNAKFDLVSLETLGIKYEGSFYDTMLMAHMINENLVSKKLEDLSQLYLKDGKAREDVVAFAKAFGWNNIPSEMMTSYAEKDAELTHRLFEKLYPEFEKQGFEDLWDTEQKWTRLLIKMERRGVLVDTDLCLKMAKEGEYTMADIVETLGGYSPSSPLDLEELLINQLGLSVHKLTPGGKREPKPSFDKEAMEIYDAQLETLDNDTASLILEYRGWQKAVTSNYRPYVELLSPDGRLRPNYKIHGTRTGRLSCEKPNLQQIPRLSNKTWNGKMKQCFIASPGYVLVEADYSQLELRLGTAYADEESLKQVFLEDRDIFTEMSEQLGMARHDTKTMVYTIQYGGGINRLSNVFRISEAEAAVRRNTYYNHYPKFRKVTNAASAKARSQGFVRMWTGRRRHFRDPEAEAHKAFNAIIQGGAAEIVKHSMLRLSDHIDDDANCRMLLQVHDSVVFEIKEELVDEYSQKIKEVMEDVRPDFGVKFKVDVHKWANNND